MTHAEHHLRGEVLRGANTGQQRRALTQQPVRDGERRRRSQRGEQGVEEEEDDEEDVRGRSGALPLSLPLPSCADVARGEVLRGAAGSGRGGGMCLDSPKSVSFGRVPWRPGRCSAA